VRAGGARGAATTAFASPAGARLAVKATGLQTASCSVQISLGRGGDEAVRRIVDVHDHDD
jgi:hypothetical protein